MSITLPTWESVPADLTIPMVIRLEADASDVEPGEYFRTYRRPILSLDGLDTFPVYVEVRNIKTRTDLLPRERCAHFWTEWTRFGDAECHYCGTHAWSPYFMANDVFGEDSLRNCVGTMQRLDAQADHWEGLARDLTNADWATREGYGTCSRCSAVCQRLHGPIGGGWCADGCTRPMSV